MHHRLLTATRLGVAVLPILGAVAWIAFDPFVLDYPGVLLMVALVCGYLASAPFAGRTWFLGAVGVVLVGLLGVGWLAEAGWLPAVPAVLEGHPAVALTAAVTFLGVLGAFVGDIFVEALPRPSAVKPALVTSRPGAWPFTFLAALAAGILVRSPDMAWAVLDGALFVAGVAVTAVFLVHAGRRRPMVLTAVVSDHAGRRLPMVPAVLAAFALLSVVALVEPHVARMFTMGVLVAVLEYGIAVARRQVIRNDVLGLLGALVALALEAAALSIITAAALMPHLAWAHSAWAFPVEAVCGAWLIGQTSVALALTPALRRRETPLL
ncbi:hypothetical protein DSM104299_00499 [Baekduia alba]|uniref:hypothetical protein n=1 Tax=Baekduia alba TaxID=2997333 RepID=UPI002341E103|nr:hypothetical protein [Baekduia alba]WCB91821.1 hypothetical protein DSM104299_00499 [Baekduia alba]